MRQTGKTTRTIDKAVQQLFEKGEITIPSGHRLKRWWFYNEPGKEKMYEENSIVDPDWEVAPNVQANLFSRILDRLHVEHHGKFEVSKSTMVITLKK